jgi:hypothetical protein
MAWPVLFIAGLVIPVVLSGPANDNFGAAIPVLLLAACVYRVAWLSFRRSADGLVIRNYFYTRRVPISQVVGFEVGARSIRVLTRERAIPIDVYTFRAPWILLSSPARLNQVARELSAWAEDARKTPARVVAEPATPADPG